MRFWLYSVLLLMSMNGTAEPAGGTPGLEPLSWMVGSWKGSLGPQTVEETWTPPLAGSMEAMVRLSSPEGVQVLEFITIREVQLDDGSASLVLHLRQFSPALELFNSEEMKLVESAPGSHSFIAEPANNLRQLTYTRTEQGQIQAEVITVTGDTFGALLQRD
jgi:hypothetical protein